MKTEAPSLAITFGPKSHARVSFLNWCRAGLAERNSNKTTRPAEHEIERSLIFRVRDNVGRALDVLFYHQLHFSHFLAVLALFLFLNIFTDIAILTNTCLTNFHVTRCPRRVGYR